MCVIHRDQELAKVKISKDDVKLIVSLYNWWHLDLGILVTVV